MTDDISLGTAIVNAVQEWTANHGGGFPLGFVAALEYVNSDGEPMLVVAADAEQPTHRSLGLAAYLDLWYRDDAQSSWRSLWEADGA